jgi:RNA polymerase sigma-70 factor (ECF subfamily)
MSDRNVNDSRASFGPLSGTSTTLLRKAVAEDRQAWNDLVKKYGAAIYMWCRKYCSDRHDAKDVAQEVVAAAYQNLGRFRHDRDSDTFRGWLRTIATNKARDEARRRRRRLAIAEGGSDAQVRLTGHADEPEEETSIVQQHLTELEALRQGINDRDWTICSELLNEVSTPKELAERFELSLDNVYVIRYRVIKRMRAKREAMKNETAGGTAEHSVPYSE